MNTYSIKHSDIHKNWYVVDASGKTLGRLATQISHVLRGKNKVDYTPHMDMGDFVIVINAEKVRVSGNKEKNKKYFFHTGYPGHHRQVSVSKMRQDSPEFIITNAVKGMLPHNKLGRKILKNLKVFSGPEHLHQAQKPKELEF
tara:strand:- start:1879 stop:2307 length:429 start_codon:yes stop_codon:yes gene_type:complete